MKSDIGLIGLGVMGRNLVLNMERNGYRVSVYNRTPATTERFIAGEARGRERITGVYSLKELVDGLETPRLIMLMVKAGEAVEAVIRRLLPYLEQGDIIIDGGNSYFKDTIRRAAELEEKGLHYLGVGISGGEEGALKGPSIMPGGAREAWERVSKVFASIAAKVDGVSCCSYLGPDGAGHFVKMAHNGIEYSDMQLICEAYYLMREVLGLTPARMSEIFSEWRHGELESYLIEITADILAKKDLETGKPMVDLILDRAGQKGTGKWTAQEALDLGVSVPSIAEAVFARCIAAIKEERVVASKALPGPKIDYQGNEEELIADIRAALYASKICSYAQGFALLKAASLEYGWDLQFGEIALLWRGGCIIRARFLDRIKEAFDREPALSNLLLDPYFKEALLQAEKGWRRVVSVAALMGVPVPAFSSALAYYDSYRSQFLPANLLQAQRDYFGAHTYERLDRPGNFHTNWLVDGEFVTSEE